MHTCRTMLLLNSCALIWVMQDRLSRKPHLIVMDASGSPPPPMLESNFSTETSASPPIPIVDNDIVVG